MKATQTAKIFRLLTALGGFVLLTGAKGACFYTGPDTIVYETIEPHPTTVVPAPGETVVVEETITHHSSDGSTVVVTETTTTLPVYFGDLELTYDFAGFTCGEMNIWTFDMALYDWAGELILHEFDMPCDIYSQIQILDLEMGSYTMTLIGHDPFGYETLIADIEFYHEDWFTPLHLSL